MTRLIVESVHRISSRPWVFVTGRLEGGGLRIGDEMTVTDGDAHTGSAVVRSIELHSAPGKTTIAVDAELARDSGMASCSSTPDEVVETTADNDPVRKTGATPMAATQFRVNEVFDIPTLGGLIAVGSTQGGEFVGIPRLCDEVSRQPIHVLGVEHPTPRTLRTGETILVVDRADAEYTTIGRLWTAEGQ
jgi:hypothetical protein